MNATYLTFGCYLAVMIGVGLYFCRRAGRTVESYLLGGRGLGRFVTALSAQASDMSGWLLMGLPGAIYLLGFSQIWIAVGLAAGTFANWWFVAPRLRTFTAKLEALTIAAFLDKRYADRSRVIRMAGAFLTLFFFTIYAASGMAGAGKLFNSMFDISYSNAVLLGVGVMVVYTLAGGYLAVCWTDLLQGWLMLFAIVAVPLIAWFKMEPGVFEAACDARRISMGILPDNMGLGMGLIAIFSTAAWGFGYFGQPHILSRFMSVRSVKLLPQATLIAMSWVIVSLFFAVFVGLMAIPLFDNLPSGDNEKVFIYMVRDLLPASLGGVMLAAILAAVMSTIDSQLLASSTTLVEDFYTFFFRQKATERERLHVSRLCVLGISLAACVMALNPENTVFGLVKFAWGGLGAVFGPAVLAGLYWRSSSSRGIICGMALGTVVLLGWYWCGLGSVVYEIVPGMAANFAGIWIFSRLYPPSAEVLAQFDALEADHRGKLCEK